MKSGSPESNKDLEGVITANEMIIGQRVNRGGRAEATADTVKNTMKTTAATTKPGSRRQSYSGGVVGAGVDHTLFYPLTPKVV